MVRRSGPPLNTLRIIHILDQEGCAGGAGRQRNRRLIQRVRKLDLHQTLSPDLIEQAAEGVELLGRKRVFFAEIAARKTQELDASRAQASNYFRAITHKSMAARVFGSRPEHRKHVAATQIWAEGQALIQVNVRLCLTRYMHDKGSSACKQICSAQNSRDNQYTCQEQQQKPQARFASFWALDGGARHPLDFVHGYRPLFSWAARRGWWYPR